MKLGEVGILVKRISGGGSKEHAQKDWVLGSKNLLYFAIDFTSLFESSVSKGVTHWEKEL